MDSIERFQDLSAKDRQQLLLDLWFRIPFPHPLELISPREETWESIAGAFASNKISIVQPSQEKEIEKINRDELAQGILRQYQWIQADRRIRDLRYGIRRWGALLETSELSEPAREYAEDCFQLECRLGRIPHPKEVTPAEDRRGYIDDSELFWLLFEPPTYNSFTESGILDLEVRGFRRLYQELELAQAILKGPGEIEKLTRQEPFPGTLYRVSRIGPERVLTRLGIRDRWERQLREYYL